MSNSRIHRTCICEKSAEAQIRVYNGKQNCARLDLAIAQEAYTGDWYSRILVSLICIGIENELSEFSVITYHLAFPANTSTSVVGPIKSNFKHKPK